MKLVEGRGFHCCAWKIGRNLRITAKQCYILCVADSPAIIVRTIDPCQWGHNRRRTSRSGGERAYRDRLGKDRSAC
jgi:hypothetical protein